MSCIDDIVGLKGCGTSPYLFYLNDLPGIVISDFDKAVSVESPTGQVALQENISLAAKHVRHKINAYLDGKYKRKTVIENGVAGYFNDDKEVISAQAGKLTGFEIRIDQYPYLNFHLHAIKLFANTTGTVPVYVYDLIQGKLLDTINVSAVAGEIAVKVCDKTYATERQRLNLFIGYASLDSYKTSLLSPFATGFKECHLQNGCYTGFSNYIYFRNAKIGSSADKVRANVDSNETSSGLSLNYSLQCGFEEHLCSMSNLLAMPLAYKAGALAMMEMKHSKRLTGVVTVYGKSHDELMNYYEAEHEKMMGELLQNMALPNSYCFECTPRVKSVVSLP